MYFISTSVTLMSDGMSNLITFTEQKFSLEKWCKEKLTLTKLNKAEFYCALLQYQYI